MNDVLTQLGGEISKINREIDETHELITALREAGEETAELESELKKTEIRKNRWQNMLEARGISVA